MFEVSTAKWASVKQYFSQQRRFLQQKGKRSRSKYKPKAKSVGEKKLYCHNEK